MSIPADYNPADGLALLWSWDSHYKRWDHCDTVPINNHVALNSWMVYDETDECESDRIRGRVVTTWTILAGVRLHDYEPVDYTGPVNVASLIHEIGDERRIFSIIHSLPGVLWGTEKAVAALLKRT